MLVFDIESDGLLDTVSVIHCLNVIDRDTGKRLAFNAGVYRDGTPAHRDGTIVEGLALLESAKCIAGHKINWYDVPAIRKLFPKFNPKATRFDSLVCSQVIWTDLTDRDFACLRTGKLPEEFQKSGLVGSHSLAAWGFRLGVRKGDFDPKSYVNEETGEPHTWATIGFTQDMDVYGRQDVEVTLKLVELIESKKYAQECLDLESEVNQIIYRQFQRGFCFDDAAAMQLVAKLQRRHAELGALCQTAFEPWWAPDVAKGTAIFTPKKDNKKQGYTESAPLSKVKNVVFNPGSRDQIADRLIKLYDWEPTTFTDGGKPQVDETTLDALPYPEAKTLSESMMVEKRLGQIASGDKAWLKKATKGGIYGNADGKYYRVHGNVNTNGAVTGRMTHTDPNIAQTPKNEAPYGEECRACFIATPGLVLVGCDAEGIELRALAHYMAKYDDGEYGRAVAEGKKENETDAHSLNKKAMGFNSREKCKTLLYALIYGAQDFKLGTIVLDDFTPEQTEKFNLAYPTSKKKVRLAAIKKLGTTRRERLMTNLPAFGKVVEAVQAAVSTRGYLKGLDGRILHVRAAHAALNTLLQSAGAVLMKRALVLFERDVAKPLRTEGATVEYVANVHDEAQMETEEQHAEEIGKGFARAIERAGQYYKFRCPLAGSYGVGRNWKETH